MGMYPLASRGSVCGPLGVGAVSAGGVLILDEFTAVNGTPINGRAPSPIDTPGGTWSVLQGVPTIKNNKFTRPGANVLAYVPSGVSDGVLACDFVEVAAANVAIGIAYRVTDLSNYWLCRINTAVSPTTIEIVEITSGSVVVRATTNHVYNSGVSYTITLTLAGAAMSALCDGATVSYSSAVRQSVTNHGIRLFSVSASEDTADNFSITT